MKSSICQDLISQLISTRFPTSTDPHSAMYNNKHLFKAYKDQKLVITVQPTNVKDAEIYINNQKASSKFSSKQFEIDITKYLHDGNNNRIEVRNIVPVGAYLDIFIPYPFLEKSTPDKVGFNLTKLNKVDELISNDVKNGFPGAALLIIKNGKIVKQSVYGFARKYSDNGTLLPIFEDIKNDTLFDLASNSKMYSTNFALMRLASIKEINLDDFVTKFLPKYKGTDKNGESRETRKISDLLWHCAGNYPDYQMFNPKNVPPDCYSINKTGTELILETRVPFAGKRGGPPVYSDLDFMLLGMIVESVTKMNLDQYVEQNIYKLLNLSHTMYKPKSKGFTQKDAAATEIIGNTRNNTIFFPHFRNYTLQGEVHDEKAYYCMEGVSGHAGLFSTTEDLSILLQTLLNMGGYKNVKFWDQNTQLLFVSPNSYDNTYGLGWRRNGDSEYPHLFGAFASSEAFGHTGWTGTSTLIDPKYDLGIIYLTNNKHSPCINGQFQGLDYLSAEFGNVMTLIYEAFLLKN